MTEQPPESTFTVTTDESVITSKRERNAKKLRKSEKYASAVPVKYMSEKKEESHQEATAVHAFL